MLWKRKKKAPERIAVDDRLQHIAFIMDGNGRWAQHRGMPREYGHTYGAATFKRIGRYCKSIGIRYMTVYAFSTENWKRPQNDVHIRFIGNLRVFPEALREKMDRIHRETAHKTFLVNIAVNYGGREEIAHACNALIAQGKTQVTEADIGANLYTDGCPDPDLIVRTGGDLRTSNFLLWQSAYAEYYFTDVLWPDYSAEDVDAAICAFYSRKRRYGGV